MFELVKDNVHKIVDTEYEAKKWLRAGYKEVRTDIPSVEIPTEVEALEILEVDALTALSYKELKEVAREMGIELEGNPSKVDLFEAIREFKEANK